ncbi:MAG: DNA topology modulation protein [Clostridia bacterium]|nr:DNA topology modulation protein [Clostridia bacterium]
MKIAIIGYSGSGKSTLARKLGQKYGVDVLHLDAVHWLPGWKERSREEKNIIVGEFLDTHSAWVIDGNYSKQHFERRMAEADQIIFMSFNRFACLWRVIKRYRTYKGKTREDMGAGCNEKVDRAFVKWVLHDGRTKKAKSKYHDVMEHYGDKVIIIKNQRQLDSFEKEQAL